MTIRWIPLVVLLVVNFVLDLWTLRKLWHDKRWHKVKTVMCASLSVVLLVLIVAVIVIPGRECSDSTFRFLMWSLFVYYSFYMPRYLAAMVWAPTHLKRSGQRTRRAGSIAATSIGILAFAFMWSGVFYTSNKIKVNRVELEFENLPQEFDGYQIAQFSDTHLGTWSGDTRFIAECVDSINSLGADMICFTGDLVNRHSAEALPFKKVLSKLHAPDGVVSVLGNHDDAHYKKWPSPQAQQADAAKLVDIEKEMGWKVLINDHIILRRDTSEMAVVGTKCFEGWPFARYASLDTALVDYATTKRFVVLLQHIPDQWKMDSFYQKRIVMLRVVDKVDLMLSGHTHAMQMMISLLGRNISPAVFQTKYWGGLYTEGDHKLYTNIGLGMVGMPARLGAAYPEVTLITLKRRGECIADADGNRIQSVPLPKQFPPWK